MKRQQAFTLLELMIVVAVLAIVASRAIPSLLNARKLSHEAATISALRTLTTVNEQYQTRFDTYPGSLAHLANESYIDNGFGAGQKHGYDFTYAGSADTWSCAADPTTPGQTGDRYFYLDQTGVIRLSTTGTATSTDPPLD